MISTKRAQLKDTNLRRISIILQSFDKTPSLHVASVTWVFVVHLGASSTLPLWLLALSDR